MSDVDAAQAAETNIVRVALAHLDDFVEIDAMAIPGEVFTDIILRGLTEYVNKTATSKAAGGITKLEGKALEDRKAELRKRVEANVEAINTGVGYKAKGTKAKGDGKVPAAVKTEAMRIARNIVKDEIKKAKQKINSYANSEITAFAKAALEANPEWYQLAEKNLAERATVPIKGLDVSKMKVDVAKVAKAEADKAARAGKKGKGGQLSATQAGIVAPKKKPEAGRPTAH